ncbi:MAG TPA: hypothetical protein VFI96_04125 [Longimicrobiaceae bacterium]|nr:hypothetical protein [Longimicrobiaceae bacterium]
MRRLLPVTLGCLLPLLLARPAQAQTIPSPYDYIDLTQSVEIFAGYVHAQTGDFGVGPEPAAYFGATYAGRLTGPLAGTVTLGYIPTHRTIFSRAAGDSVLTARVPNHPAQLLLAEAGVRFQITGPRTWNGLAPYVGIGGGVVTDLSASDSLEATLEQNDQLVELGPSFAVSLSAGTDWFLTERLSLRAEAQDHLWRLNTPGGLTGNAATNTEWTNNLGVTLGVALHF